MKVYLKILNKKKKELFSFLLYAFILIFTYNFAITSIAPVFPADALLYSQYVFQKLFISDYNLSSGDLLTAGTSDYLFPWLDRIWLPIIQGMIYGLTDPSHYTVVKFASILYGFTAVLLAMYFRNSTNYIAAFLGTICVMSNFAIVTDLIEVIPEVYLLIFTLITVLFGVRFENSGSLKWLYLTGVFATFSCFAKVVGAFNVLAVLIFFLNVSQHQKKVRNSFKKIFIVSALSSGIPILLFGFMYGFEDLIFMISRFFGVNIEENFVGRKNYDNFVNVFTFLFNNNNFYAGLFLILLPKFFNNVKIRFEFWVVICHLVGVAVIYLATERGFKLHSRYVLIPIFLTYMLSLSTLLQFISKRYSLGNFFITGSLVVVPFLVFIGWKYHIFNIFEVGLLSGETSRPFGILLNISIIVFFVSMIFVDSKERFATVSLVTFVLWNCLYSFPKGVFENEKFYAKTFFYHDICQKSVKYLYKDRNILLDFSPGIKKEFKHLSNLPFLCNVFYSKKGSKWVFRNDGSHEYLISDKGDLKAYSKVKTLRPGLFVFKKI